ncbi:protein kinase domain-containing protein [Embleya scabrispora]|uniref:protein kinase domain-containing protein n=1 Tax=Embleya scabrispora TaxID=159449 RepID=UPI0003794399|nr:protein kinase [Embleya scabrispora]MYS79749.1 protein kinase [Streptomyces sp. SID5474]
MTPPNGPDDHEAPGTQVKTVGSGRYELGRQLGRGGMAEVLMAHDVRLGRTVAVKTLRPDLAQDPVARSRFGREAQNAASLNHPAIVSVYDTGEDRVGDELVPFIVMECVEGRTVRELLGEGNPIPLEQALRVTEGILEALEYSHRNGIIHRDIKPANVIITNSGAVKVMDFGIARAMHSAATTMTQTGMVMGTPQYLSPEQALGRTVDARSDLYSSGCLLYELLALRPPFNGDTPLSVVYQHVQDDPRPPSMMDPRVPPHLDAIALKALAKNPDDRYQTADEMRMDIRRALAGQQVSVVVPPRVPAQQRPEFGSWSQVAAGTAAASAHTGSAEATAAMPPLAGRTGTGAAVPGQTANDGGTGPLPILPHEPPPKRKVPLYLVAALAVVLVVVGAVLLVKGLPGGGDSPSTQPNTPSVAPSGNGVAQPGTSNQPNPGGKATSGTTPSSPTQTWRGATAPGNTRDPGGTTSGHSQAPSSPPPTKSSETSRPTTTASTPAGSTKGGGETKPADPVGGGAGNPGGGSGTTP